MNSVLSLILTILESNIKSILNIYSEDLLTRKWINTTGDKHLLIVTAIFPNRTLGLVLTWLFFQKENQNEIKILMYARFAIPNYRHKDGALTFVAGFMIVKKALNHFRVMSLKDDYCIVSKNLTEHATVSLNERWSWKCWQSLTHEF